MAEKTANGVRGGCLVTTLVIMALAGVGVIWSMTTGSSSTPSASAPGEVLAPCDHFRDIDRDIAQGILTDAEIRGKAQELRVDALNAPSDIQDAVTEYIAGATTLVQSGDRAEFGKATFDLSSACGAHGG